ncbi:MAG: ABC transporter permease subunit [Sciscionella sp.]
MSELSQLVLSGASVGCISALVALGFVIIASVTGVYNFAQGDYVMAGAMVAAWSLHRGLAWPLASLVAVAAVAIIAAVQERLTVAPVRGKASPLALVVASLGVAVVLRGLALVVFGSDLHAAPAFVPGVISVAGARLSTQVLFIWGVTAIALIAVAGFFRVSRTGWAMRAMALNPQGARLLGVRIGPLSLAAFVMSGALCGLVGAVTVPLTLVSWSSGVSIGLTGFIAAAIGQFRRPVRAVAAGIGLGIVASLAAGYVSSTYPQLVVYGVLLAYLYVRDITRADGVLVRLHRRSRRTTDLRKTRVLQHTRPHLVSALVIPPPPLPSESVSRRLRRFLPIVVIALTGLLPMLAGAGGVLDAALVAVLLAIGATGLNLVMGMAGQLSLGQGAFYLLGGYTAAILTATHGWPSGLALVAAIAVAATGGMVIGWLTLRLDGLNLAIATLAVNLGLLVAVTEDTGLTGGTRGTFGVPSLRVGGIGLTSSTTFYLCSLMVLVVCLVLASSLWRSRIGLSLRAIGIDQPASEVLGLRAFRLKLIVFTTSSAMAGLAGALWVFYFRFADPTTWGLTLTIDLVTFVIIGGLGSVYGGFLGVVALQTVRYFLDHGSASVAAQNTELLLSGLLLIIFALLLRRGLAGITTSVPARDGLNRLLSVARGLRTPAVAARTTETGSALHAEVVDPVPHISPAPQVTVHTNADSPVMQIRELSKRFGPIVAADQLDFELFPGTITALIGPNGAGKSTVINLLSGVLVPTRGTITLSDSRIDGRRADEIARLGLARTFQTPRLFAGMSVLETVRLARDAHHRDSLLASALGTRRAGREARRATVSARHWLSFVGLDASEQQAATELPCGHQRLLEIARALAAEPTVLLLDEPAAGMDDRETEALGGLLGALADTGLAVLLVEHAMSLVMSVADRVVVLDQGRKIADSTPGAVLHDDRVKAAYLGIAL